MYMSSLSHSCGNSLTKEKGKEITRELSKILFWKKIQEDCNQILAHSDGTLYARFLTHTNISVEQILDLEFTELPNGEIAYGDTVYSVENIQEKKPWIGYKGPKLIIDNT